MLGTFATALEGCAVCECHMMALQEALVFRNHEVAERVRSLCNCPDILKCLAVALHPTGPVIPLSCGLAYPLNHA